MGLARAQADGVQREFSVACSYLEIHNESITDLLTAETGLPIREDPRTGPFVEGLSVEAVKDGERFYQSQHLHCTSSRIMPLHTNDVCLCADLTIRSTDRLLPVQWTRSRP